MGKSAQKIQEDQKMSCAVLGCGKNDRVDGFRVFGLPSVIDYLCDKTRELSSKRRALWLSRINRDFSGMVPDGKTVKVCGRHFITGKPSRLFDCTNPDWAPNLLLSSNSDKDEPQLRRGNNGSGDDADGPHQQLDLKCKPTLLQNQEEIDGNDYQSLPSTSSAYRVEKADVHVKQEEVYDSELSCMDDEEKSVKKEADLIVDDAQSQDHQIIKSGNSFFNKSLPKDFDFIRSCLAVVLYVGDHKRHQLVKEMKFRLKLIEARTTGMTARTAGNVNAENPDRSKQRPDGPHHESLTNVRAASGDELTESGQEDSTSDVRLGEDKLIRTLGDGSVVCNVCERLLFNRRSCAACCSFVSRMRMRLRDNGSSLLMCGHANFSGGRICKSCRFRKYVALRKSGGYCLTQIGLSTEQPPPSRSEQRSSPKPSTVLKRRRRKKARNVTYRTSRKCIICENISPWYTAWRCRACVMFHSRLIARFKAGRQLPACDHNGEYARIGCRGCRYIRLQREAARRNPMLASRLPDVSSVKAEDA